MPKQRLILSIYGLSWDAGGALCVERSIHDLPGVSRVYINPATEMAYVEFDSELCSPGQLTVAVERAGYRAGEPAGR